MAITRGDRAILIKVWVPYVDGADYLDQTEADRLLAYIQGDVEARLDEQTDGSVLNTDRSEAEIEIDY